MFGVYLQPAEYLATWKARGVDTLFGIPLGHDPVAWLAQARALGFKYLLGLTDPYDPTDPNLLAVMLPDEPEDNNVTTATLLADIKALHAKGVKAYVNFDGYQFSQPWQKFDYPTIAANADWISLDVYPFNGGQVTSTAQYATRLAALRKMNLKAQFSAFLECSDQNQRVQAWAIAAGWAPNMRAPTVAEFWAEAGAITAAGAGIVLFPYMIGNATTWPADFDQTTADLVGQIPLLANAINTPPVVQPAQPAPLPVPMVSAAQVSADLSGLSQQIAQLVAKYA